MRLLGVLSIAILASSPPLFAQPPNERQREYLNFIKAQATQLRATDKPPATREEWDARRLGLRDKLQQAFGPFPEKACPLEPKVLGVLQRDGYRVEKIIFQTMPGVWMTASAYVPDKPGPHPALLAVHGHWKGARLDPVLQKRCIGPAKLGYFVLAVDAFGAGERGLSKKLGEYHGEMVAATLLPTGMTLAGLQVYENMRAVDYLQTRPEVDAKKIAITGASGGGNQTMYAGAWDDRFGAVVPVCSVGNYQAYLGIACCMCEVVPGALRFTEEGGILGLTAPRGLMVINVTKDGVQFSIPEAKKSLAYAAGVYKVYDKPDSVRHTTFDWHHDYSQAMREALYGWLAKHLKGEGDGSPIPDPPMKTEDPEALRCFPGDTRPADWMTIPRYAAAEGRRLLAARKAPKDAEAWGAESNKLRTTLVEKILGGYPKGATEDPRAEGKPPIICYQSEPGIWLNATSRTGVKNQQGSLAIVLDLDGAEKAAQSAVAKSLHEDGWKVMTVDLRATGALAWTNDKVGGAPDHNTAQWGLWIGRPLLGQWTLDIRRLLDAVQRLDGKLPEQIAVVGHGPAGIVALTAAATDSRITHVVAVDSLASYVTDAPYKNQRLGLMAPGMLREVGDVAHLAALCLPRRVIIAGGVLGDGTKLSAEDLRRTFEPTAQVSTLLKANTALQLLSSDDTKGITMALRSQAPAKTPSKPVVWNLDNLESIGGNKVTVVGKPRVIETDQGKAIEFDGRGDGLFVAANPLAGLKEFTAEVIFRPAAGGPKEQRFLHFQPKESEDRLLFETRLTPDARWFLDTYLQSGNVKQTLFAEKFLHKFESWQHAAVVVDGKSMRHYVNGKEELAADIQPAPLAAGQTSIGMRFNQVFWFQGAIRQIRVTPAMLKPEGFLKR